MSEADTAFEAECKARLERERADLEALLAAHADDCAPVALDQQRVGRLSRMEAMQGQAMAEEAGRRREARLQRIRSALSRIADGTFGECARCGETIAQGRLAADPTCLTCVACAGGAQAARPGR